MSEYSPKDIDTEADKIGSYFVARYRHDDDAETTDDTPQPSTRGGTRKPRRTGRPAIEISGRDVIHNLAEQERIENPDERTPEERIRTNARGAALARVGLESPINRLMRERQEAIDAAEPEDRDKVEQSETARMNARIRALEEKS